MKKLLLTLAMVFTVFSCGGSAKTENKIIVNLNEEGATLDTSLLTDNVGGTINNMLNEGLVRVTKTGEFEKGLAKEIKESPDGLKYSIKLKDGLKWSNGDPITSDDFIYSWTRALDPKTAAAYAYMLYPIKNAEEFNSGKAKASDLGLKKINDKEFEVVLDRVTPYFENLLAFTTYLPLNEKFVKSKGDSYALEPEHLVSSGPFVMKDWTHGTEMVLVKNKNYYDAKNVKLDKIVIKFISDTAASLNAFNNGELDFVSLGYEQYKKYEGNKNLVFNPLATSWYIEINHNSKILSNRNIRKAIALSLDTNKMVKVLTNNVTASFTDTFTPAGVGIFGESKDFVAELKEKGYKPNKFNPEEAKKYLAKGLKELGLKTLPPISIIVNDSGSNKKTVIYLQDELRKNLGIDINIEVMTYKERLARMSANNFDLVYAGWGADFLDPINFLDLLLSTSGNNHGKFNNKKYDELITKAYNETNKAKRFEYLRQAEQLNADEVGNIMLLQSQRVYIVNPKFKGILFPGFGSSFILQYVEKVK